MNELKMENQWILCWKKLKSKYCSNLLWKLFVELSYNTSYVKVIFSSSPDTFRGVGSIIVK